MNKKYLMMFTAAALVMSSFSVSAEEKKELPPFDGAPHHMRMDHDGKKMPPNPKKMDERLADDLGLSEIQRVQAKQIHEKGRKQVRPLMEQMRDIREKMDELREENMKEFEKILTPEQREKFAKIKDRCVRSIAVPVLVTAVLVRIGKRSPKNSGKILKFYILTETCGTC